MKATFFDNRKDGRMDMEKTNRSQWGNRTGFILAAVGSAVGLGNIWRYSYVAFKNGGGAFLIPYFVALLTAGIPLVMLEFALGHKMRGSAPLSFKKINDRFEWVGWLSIMVTFIVTVYYVVIIGWCLNYIFFSANQSWGQDAGAFFFNNFLHITEGVDVVGGIIPAAAIAIAIIWAINFIIVYFGIKNGIEKAGKIIMPILAICTIVIVIRALTLPGAIIGVNQYLAPDFSKLLNHEVWLAAYGQIFYDLSIAFGILIAYSSYLPKKSDIANSAFIMSFANCGFSFLIGMGVFGVLGFMSQASGKPFDEIVKAGISLAFVAFPSAIAQMPFGAKLFGIAFFVCLVVAGLSSSISLIEAVVSSIIDKFNVSRKKAVIFVCGTGFLGSLLFTGGNGLYVLDIIDAFINNYGLIAAGLLEAIILGWVYKAENLREHINEVSDFKIGKWWDICIKYLIPAILLTITSLNIYKDLTKPYEGYPIKALLLLGVGSIIVSFVGAFALKSFRWQHESKAQLANNDIA